MQLALRRAVTAKVPRFFSHLYDEIVARDEEGQELRDEAAARIRARVSVREMACAEVLKGHLNLSHRIDVEDESGSLCATVHFRDVVQIEA